MLHLHNRLPTALRCHFPLLGVLILSHLVFRVLYSAVTHLSIDEDTYFRDLFYPLAEKPNPNWIFQAFFQFASACGGETLTCARFINRTLLGCGALILSILAASIHGATKPRAFAWLPALIGPISIYGESITPDIVFYAIFWLLLLVLWSSLQLPGHPISHPLYTRAIILGISLSSLVMVKPHGFLILGIYVAYIITIFALSPQTVPGIFRIPIALLTLCSAAIHWSLWNWQLPMSAAAHPLLGNNYGSVWARTSYDHALILLANLPTVIGGWFFLGLKYSYLLLQCLLVANEWRTRHPQSPKWHFASFLLFTSGVYTLIIILFTAWTPVVGDSSSRIHTRYIAFLGIALLLIAGCQPPPALTVTKRLHYLGATTVLILVGNFGLSSRYQASFFDAPDLYFVASGLGWRGLFIAVLLDFYMSLVVFRLTPPSWHLYLWAASLSAITLGISLIPRTSYAPTTRTIAFLGGAERGAIVARRIMLVHRTTNLGLLTDTMWELRMARAQLTPLRTTAALIGEVPDFHTWVEQHRPLDIIIVATSRTTTPPEGYISVTGEGYVIYSQPRPSVATR